MILSLKKKMKYYYIGIRSLVRYMKAQTGEKSEYNRIAAELSRNVHSIEKGLSLENPRMGFGRQKLESMMEEIDILCCSKSDYHQEVIDMSLDSIDAYIDFHNDSSNKGEFCKSLEKFLNNHKTKRISKRIGGVKTLRKTDVEFDLSEGERFFNTRHSIRDFDSKPVDEILLKKALLLAQRAPSACNRQGVRAYVLNSVQKSKLIETLSGVGGFANSADKYVMITAKTTAYRTDEINQYIVSASIYAAYLTMTLHLYGLGSCVIQRPVVWTKSWEKERALLQIDTDEQLICLLAVGNLKDECRVPLSHRLKNDEMVRFL